MKKRALLILLIFLLTLDWVMTAIYILEEREKMVLVILFIGTTVVSLILMHMLAVMTPRQQLGNIRALANQIEHRVVENDLSQFNEADSPQEVLPLVRSINRLLHFQQDRYEQEREFTANASHELRTPLAGIRLQTQIALKTEDPEQKEKALKNILTAIDRSTRLVEQLLILSRLTSDRIELEMERIDLSYLTSRACGEIEELARDRNIAFDKRLDQALPIICSADSLGILINNILRNAMTYSPAGTSINISTDHDDHHAILVIRDHGPGIPPDQRSAVLERFRKAFGNKGGGTGLGLAIVKRIADLHRAELILGEPDDGSTGLVVTLKFNRPPEQDAG